MGLCWAERQPRKPIGKAATTYQAIRRTDKASAPRLREIGGIRLLHRSDGELVALFENRYRLARLEADEPELTLEPLVAGAIPVP